MMDAKRWRLLELLVIAGLIGTLFLPWLNDLRGFKGYFSASLAPELLTTTFQATKQYWIRTEVHAYMIIMMFLSVICLLLYVAIIVFMLLAGIFVCISWKKQKFEECRKKPLTIARALLIAQMITVVFLSVAYNFGGGISLFPSWGMLVTIGLMIAEKKVRHNLERYEKYERRLREKYPPDKRQTVYESKTSSGAPFDHRWNHPDL